MEKNYISKAFTVSIVLVSLFCLLIVAKFFTFVNFSLFILFRKILIISICIALITGSFFTLKGIKERNSWKKIIALVINFGLGGLCFLALINNLIEEYGN